MCGIAGIVHLDQKPIDIAALDRMVAALVHRGPDGAGVESFPGVGLGHRRLSIIDLDGGGQPLCNEDRTVWVTFNGEIFNYIELRKDLEKRGHVFRTATDTETLVHLYEERGTAFVDELNGQFAIALWDVRRRRLVLARDRVGIRPLFHSTLGDGTLLFASEAKALFAHGGIQAKIDPIAIGQIAELWACIPPRTCFIGVEELPPGCMLVFEGGKRKMNRYWRPQFPAEHEYEERTEQYWKEQVREAVHAAVRLQLRADVPVGAYLSGGLDSSILASIVKRDHNSQLSTFSVCFDQSEFDERKFQQNMVSHIETNHHEVQVDASAIGRLFSKVVWFAERPILRTAPAPLLALSALVREHGIKVVLSGEGADEIFGGYNIFREDKVRRFWSRQPESSWRPALLSRLYGYVKRDARADSFWRLFFRGALERTDDPLYSHRIRWHNSSHIKHVFHPEFRALMQDDDALFSELGAYLGPDMPNWHPLCRAQYIEMELFMSCYLLNSQGDRMTMGNSVEGRVPFLDHHLIALAARIPPKFKIRGLQEKYVLKRAFLDSLPAEIVCRPKQPYRAPISSCFFPGSKNLGAQLLSAEAIESAGMLKAKHCKALMQKATATGLGERDEMCIAIAASLQLLHYHFVANAVAGTS